MAIEPEPRAASPPTYENEFLPYPEPIRLEFDEREIRFPVEYVPGGFGMNTSPLPPPPPFQAPSPTPVPTGTQDFAFALGEWYLDPAYSIVIGTSTEPGPVNANAPAINDFPHDAPIHSIVRSYAALQQYQWAPPSEALPPYHGPPAATLHSYGEPAFVSTSPVHNHRPIAPTPPQAARSTEEDILMADPSSNSVPNDDDSDDARSTTSSDSCSSSGLTEIGSDEFAPCFEERGARLWLSTGGGVRGDGGAVGGSANGNGPLFHSHGTSQYRYPLPVDGPEQMVRSFFHYHLT